MRKRKLFKFAVLGVTSAFLVGQAALPFDALSSKVSADEEVNPKHLAIFMGDMALGQPLPEAKPSLGGLGSLFAETFIGALQGKPAVTERTANPVEDPNAPKGDEVEENLDGPTGKPEGVESPAPGEGGELGGNEDAPAPEEKESENVRAEEVDLDTLEDPIPAGDGPKGETLEPGGAPATGEGAPVATEEGELQAPEIKNVKFTRSEGKTTITVTATKGASIGLYIGKDERHYAQGWAINGSVDFVFEQDIPENIKFAFIPVAYEKGENGAPDFKKPIEGKKYVALTAPMVLEVKTLKKPTEKVTPVNPEKLTEEEKAAIKDNLNKANLNEDGDSTIPEGTEITVNDDGSVSIKFEGGAKQTILSKDTVKLAEEPKEDKTPEVVEEKTEENKSKVLSTGLELPRFVLSEDNKNDANNDEKTVEKAEGKALPKTAVGGFAGLFGMASISLAGLFVGRRKNK